MKPEILGYVLASNYRKKVLLSLEEKALTPTMISEKTGLYAEHVSLTLNQLMEKGLVDSLTPKLRKGKLFDLTAEGRSVLKQL